MSRIKCVILCFVFLSGNLWANDDKGLYNEYLYAFIEANRQDILGSVVESARLFHSCLEYNPNDANVLYKLSEIYYSVNNIKEAKNFAKKAYEIDDENKWIVSNLINLYIVSEQYDSALIYIKDYKEKNKDLELLHKSYVEILINKKEYKKAISYIEKNSVTSRSILLMKIHCLNALQKFKSSIDLIKSMLEEKNDDPEIYGILAETYAQNGEFSLAKSTYDKLFLLEPGNSLYLLSYFDFALLYEDTSILFEITKSVLSRDDVALKDKLYVIKNVRELGSDKLKILAEDKKTWLMHNLKEWNEDAFMLKEFLVQVQERDNAKDFMKHIFKFNEHDKNYLQNLLFMLNFENIDSTLKYSELIYNNFDMEPVFIWFYAMSLKNKKRYEDAESVIQKVSIRKIENRNIREEMFVLKGEIYESLKLFNEADRNFEAALVENPDNYMVLNNYAYYLSLREVKLEYALDLIERCINQEPKSVVYLDTYGWVLFKMKRIKEAKKIIERSIKLGGEEHYEILDHYGDILAEMNKMEKAVSVWKSAANGTNDEEKRDLILEKVERFK